MALDMKQQAIFIHGGEAFSKYDDFLEYLRTQEISNPLEKNKPQRWYRNLDVALQDSHEVYQPEMPNAENAKYIEWKIWFERYLSFIGKEVTLIGHSQGAYFLAKYFVENKLPCTVRGLFLVAAPFEKADFGLEDGGDFNFDTTKLENIAQQVKNIHIFHSKDDFVVPYEHALKFKVGLPEATLHTCEDRNHFV